MARCLRCGSDDIAYQREQTASVGYNVHKFGGGKSGHGFFYWLFIGWWIWIFKFFMWFFRTILAFCTLGLSTLFWRKKNPEIKGRTITTNKMINHTVAVCQNCGHNWKA